MKFDNLPKNPYLDAVLNIIRQGIIQSKNRLIKADREDLKNQILSNIFNVIGTTDEKLWIGVAQENIKRFKQTREDIYFYLNNNNNSRIFFIEGKRLPKYSSISDEEYVSGIHTSGSPSGGIERFKKGFHGEPNLIRDNGMIGYLENKDTEQWLEIINNNIENNYSADEKLFPKEFHKLEFLSKHSYEHPVKLGDFHMHHFWIDLTDN